MISLDDVKDAYRVVAPQIYHTPCAQTQSLSRLLGCDIHLKLENLQMTGAFKERGALNKLSSLAHEERERGVIAASAGNHAQGVAYHAQKMGITAQIVMPENTPLTKVSATKRFGADVILHGTTYDDAYHHAMNISQEQGSVFVHPFDDPLVIAGQGTIGIELYEDHIDPDYVIVPVGGGGLISGIATALKELYPRCKIIGVETSRAPSMKISVEQKRVTPVAVTASIADGIVVKQPGVHTLEIIQDKVDDIVLVEEEEIAAAIITLLDVEKTLVEGAGATPLAALMFDKIPVRDKRCVLLLSGGNIDLNLLSKIVERGLIKDGRMGRLRIELLDIPGQLSTISSCVAEQRANVIEVYHNRSFHDVPLGKTYLDITIETRGHDHIKEIIAAMEKMGYRVECL